jgi:putative FmdB family regulatory protein
MPIYEYKCDQGHVFEVTQRMIDDPVSVCAVCERPVERVFHPIAVHFKGSGFYNTDYGTKKRSREMKENKSNENKSNENKSSDSSSSSSSSSTSDSSSSSSSDSKSSKTETSSSGSSSASKSSSSD